MRKMLREHDAGTERLIDMTARRSKLMQLMIKKDFKSFHTELRPQLPLPACEKQPLSLPPPAVTQSLSGKALAAIASAALAPRSNLGRSLA